jgi:uncharacterized surface protein with fasciclin (FAS1) repeats
MDRLQDVIHIEGVKLIMTDIVASNGVIHVVDDVIVPESSRCRRYKTFYMGH